MPRPVTPISRRTFLVFGATVVAGACTTDDASSSTASSSSASPSTAPLAAEPDVPSIGAAGVGDNRWDGDNHGATGRQPVHARCPPRGDPDERSAVLWTRLVAGRDAPLADEVAVVWELAELAFSDVLASGVVPAAAAGGHSVHVTVDLDGPAWYRFLRRLDEPCRLGRPDARGRGTGRAPHRRRAASTSRPASTPPTATSPSGNPIWSCSSETSSTRRRPARGRTGCGRTTATNPPTSPATGRGTSSISPTPICRPRGPPARGS